MGIKPFPTIREAFAEVRREESKKKLMLPEANITPAVEGSPLFTHNSSQNNRTGKGLPGCDHCKRPGHMKATCWKLHGKPADWKPSNRQDRDSRANAVTSTETSVENSPFTREQIEALQKMFSQASGSSQTSSSNAEQHTSCHTLEIPLNFLQGSTVLRLNLANLILHFSHKARYKERD